MSLLGRLYGKIELRVRIFLTHVQTCYALGLRGAGSYLRNYVVARVRSGAPEAIQLRPYAHPVVARFDSSDLAVLHQIFIEEEYTCLQDISDTRFIVDCGANVGYSTVWFANRFPEARIVAVEPDDGNVAVCRMNLAPYPRASLRHAAVWSHDGSLVVKRGEYRDGRAWSTQVQEPSESETPDVAAVTIDGLLDESGFPCIDILKIDVERAEAELFAGPCATWLSRVRNIAIELHDDECSEIFFRAMAGFEYELSRSGELTVLKNIRSSAGTAP